MRTSCLIDPPGVRYVVLRDDFRDICRGSDCAGAILAVMRYLADKYDETTWVEHSIQEFVDDIRGLYEARKVRDSLAEMVEDGFLERRDEAGKRPFWRLKVDAVNDALAAWTPDKKGGVPLTKREGTPDKKGGVSENTPYICNRKIEKEEPEDDDVLRLEMYGDGWTLKRASELNTRIKITTNLRTALRRYLAGDLNMAAERRLEVDDLLTRLSGGDATAELKLLMEGYERGWKPKRGGGSGNSGGSDKSRPKTSHEKAWEALEDL